VHRDQQFSKFETYLKDRELSFKRSLSAIEQQGTEDALDRCRVLADQINRDLRDQKPGHFVNSPLLADFQLSLEQAASRSKRIRTFTGNPQSGRLVLAEICSRQIPTPDSLPWAAPQRCLAKSYSSVHGPE
jgi:hypothetical protein